MDFKIILFLCATFFGKNADAAITAWSNPSIPSGDGGSGTVATALAENAAVGETSITIAATSDGTVSTYSITAQNPAGKFSIADSGILSIVSALDYETAASHTLTITATDADGDASATVTINLSDYNDNTPTFTGSPFVANIRDGSCSASALGTYMATDADGTSANNQVTYAIAGGNTNAAFTVSTSGAVTVAIGKTVRYEDASTYVLTITGTDNGTPALTGTATVSVYVCSAPTVAVSLLTLFVALLASMK